MRERGDGETGWRGAVDNRRNEPRCHEERRQKADVAFTQSFAVGDFGEGRDTRSGSITQLQHLLSYASHFVLPLTRKAGFRLAG